MRVLLTGANGFFGRNFQEYVRNHMPRNNKVEFIFFDKKHGDLLDPSIAYRLVEGCDVVVHAAGIVGTGKFYNDNGAEVYDKITRMDWNVFQACKQRNIKKVIYIGSGSAYSPDVIENGLLKEEDFFIGLPDEYTLGYGMAKRNAYIAMKLLKIPSVYLAMSTMYGRYQDKNPNTGSFVSATLGKFQRNENPIIIGGTGKPLRDFLNACTAAWIVTKFILDYEPKDIPEIYNIGGPGPISVKEVVDIMVELFNYQGNILYDESKPDGMIMRVLDNSKLHKLFPTTYNCHDGKVVFKDTIREIMYV